MPPRIFIASDWYLPGFKAGGVVTAVSNLVESVGSAYELFLFTRDRDLTDKNAYADIRPNEWTAVGKARVVYTADLSLGHLRRRILEIAPQVIYLNSFFSTLTVKTLWLRKLGLIPACALVLAPRGEFARGALRIKAWRKFFFLRGALRLGLYGDIVWQASSELEREQIAAGLRAARQRNPWIRVASDVPSRGWLQATGGLRKPAKGSCTRFLIIARVSRNKNLLFALHLLGKLSGHVEFDIIGPLDDLVYWAECQTIIASLPSNVTVRYRGVIPHGLVPKVASEYHFFLLPTQGENFGYAILEAMAAGCPVILSDLTPWRKVMERGAGWSLPLKDHELWRRVLQQCVEMDQEPYAMLSERAREFVQEWVTSHNAHDETIQLFHQALQGRPNQYRESRCANTV
jgi:glycosyltransferase involved in cell wall biosynthesis